MKEHKREKALAEQSRATAGSGRETAGVAPAGETAAPEFAALPVGMKRHGHRHIASRRREAGELADQPRPETRRGGDLGSAFGHRVGGEAMQAAHRLRKLREISSEQLLKRRRLHW